MNDVVALPSTERAMGGTWAYIRGLDSNDTQLWGATGDSNTGCGARSAWFFAKLRKNAGATGNLPATWSRSGLAARYNYDPWGRRTKTEGSGEEGDFGFTGHYYHAPSGLHLALYRAYSAELGRWLSRDPIEERGGLNLYEYVKDQPTLLLDESGLMGCGPHTCKSTWKCTYSGGVSAGYLVHCFYVCTLVSQTGSLCKGTPGVTVMPYDEWGIFACPYSTHVTTNE